MIGDAAGIVKPLSGGGIYTGVISDKNAAIAIDDALKNEDYSKKSLSEYQNLWKKEIGFKLRTVAIIQKYFLSISVNDKLLNKVYEKINDKYIINKINSLGDIDYPSKVVISIILKNRLY
ncbi:hypothetical protein OXIME_000181 [Oxyplasma meridianum]|uniref:FAD-binding domain-containing protein n=1 Tax=Oxyplasma meridianum TaxID=3073602 RepID=A0AAX4NFY3_9ARCH